MLRVIPVTAALRAGRACHQAAVEVAAAAVVAAVSVEAVAVAAVAVAVEVAAAVVVAVAEGGRYENIPFINTGTLKGEENDISRN